MDVSARKTSAFDADGEIVLSRSPDAAGESHMDLEGYCLDLQEGF